MKTEQELNDYARKYLNDHVFSILPGSYTEREQNKMIFAFIQGYLLGESAQLLERINEPL